MLAFSMTSFAALLSDRFRLIVLPILALALLGLWLGYGRVVDERATTWDEVAGAPHLATGQRVLVSFGHVMRVGPEGFALRVEGKRVKVRGALPDLAVGRIVSVVGPLGPNGVLELEEGQVHGLRKLKWLSGLLVLCVVGGWCGRDLTLLWRDENA